MVSIKCYEAHKVPPDLATRLRSLTLRETGDMRAEFTDMRQRGSGKVWVCHDGDYVLGWALKRGASSMFYVRKAERGKGIGLKLLRKVCADSQYGLGTQVTAHDKSSTKFFESVEKKLNLEHEYRNWHIDYHSYEWSDKNEQGADSE